MNRYLALYVRVRAECKDLNVVASGVLSVSVQVNFLKSQLATQFARQNHCKADFWVFFLGQSPPHYGTTQGRNSQKSAHH